MCSILTPPPPHLGRTDPGPRWSWGSCPKRHACCTRLSSFNKPLCTSASHCNAILLQPARIPLRDMHTCTQHIHAQAYFHNQRTFTYEEKSAIANIASLFSICVFTWQPKTINLALLCLSVSVCGGWGCRAFANGATSRFYCQVDPAGIPADSKQTSPRCFILRCSNTNPHLSAKTTWQPARAACTDSERSKNIYSGAPAP